LQENRNGWEEDIKTCVKVLGNEFLDRIYLTWDRDENGVMKMWGPKGAVKLTSSRFIRLSNGVLIHGVRRIHISYAMDGKQE
jgi:hypothetical protein